LVDITMTELIIKIIIKILSRFVELSFMVFIIIVLKKSSELQINSELLGI